MSLVYRKRGLAITPIPEETLILHTLFHKSHPGCSSINMASRYSTVKEELKFSQQNIEVLS